MNMIKHIKVWNIWRKKSLNAPFFKLLVLLTIAQSPAFQLEKVFYGVDASRGFLQGIDYDFSSKKQSFKEFEKELGLHHQELRLPWNQGEC